MEQHKATENVKVDNQGSLNRWNEIVETCLIAIVTDCVILIEKNQFLSQPRLLHRRGRVPGWQGRTLGSW